MYRLTCQQQAALEALKSKGEIVNSRAFSAHTLNSLVDRGLAVIIKGTRGKSSKCTYCLSELAKTVLEGKQ
jgi:23S rRNA pseudoU1915 N3-methylase RlmH